MGFKINFIQEINNILMEKRFSDDVQTNLNIPEHKFKKMGEKFNHAVRLVYGSNNKKEIKMFHILLALQDYFDMQWIVEFVLDNKNKKIVEEEMKEEYNIKKRKYVRKRIKEEPKKKKKTNA